MVRAETLPIPRLIRESTRPLAGGQSHGHRSAKISRIDHPSGLEHAESTCDRQPAPCLPQWLDLRGITDQILEWKFTTGLGDECRHDSSLERAVRFPHLSPTTG